VLKEVVPNEPIPGEVFELNDKIDKILMDLADKHNVDVPEPLVARPLNITNRYVSLSIYLSDRRPQFHRTAGTSLRSLHQSRG
jgi:hypothetical protein